MSNGTKERLHAYPIDWWDCGDCIFIRVMTFTSSVYTLARTHTNKHLYIYMYTLCVRVCVCVYVPFHVGFNENENNRLMIDQG